MKHVPIASALAGASALVRPKAFLSPTLRADASDPKAIIAALQKGFEDFKKENDDKLKAKADVVAEEKIDRMSASLGDMQTAFDDMHKKLAAATMRPREQIGDLPPTNPEFVAEYKAWMRKGTVSAAMDKGTEGNGGYLAPVEWDRTITSKLKRISPIRANARVQTISVAGFKKVFSDRAVGSGWVGETASRPATTTPALGILDFTPGELYANPMISQQLLDDSAVDLEQWLAEEVDTEFGRQEGIAYLSGNGTNKPYGILTYVAGAANAARHPWGAISVINSGAAAALTGDGMISLMYDLPSEFTANAKLYINRLSIGAARKLKDGQGNYLWQPSYQQGEPQTLGGAPVVEIPDMPIVAAGNIAALYGDMEATYLIVDRLGISVMRDPYTNKPYVAFYTVKRVGGGVYNPEPMRALQIAA
ncbi:phage major capsid protein [Methylobacterium sp. Leaf399]|uniref:phage major capsid protein n=1 Tax=Methylobacterium sp. Leaf399 TaxID=1736364 RepID=UPI0009E993DF|nr:phage major capsid protein [Methylobacterium sp. Leaf399]